MPRRSICILLAKPSRPFCGSWTSGRPYQPRYWLYLSPTSRDWIAELFGRYACFRSSCFNGVAQLETNYSTPLQICKRWREVFDSSLNSLIPRHWDISLFAKFPYLESLDCSLCADQVCIAATASARSCSSGEQVHTCSTGIDSGWQLEHAHNQELLFSAGHYAL